MPCALQRDDYKLPKLNGSWRPAMAIDATIQPVNMAIGSTQRCDLRCIQTRIVSMSQGLPNDPLNKHVAPMGLQWP